MNIVLLANALPLFATVPTSGEDPASRFIRLLTVFLLAMWVGFEVITKVPQRLHTPLTSGRMQFLVSRLLVLWLSQAASQQDSAPCLDSWQSY